MKRFVSIIIAAVLVLGIGACAFADGSSHADDYYWQHRADVTPDGKKYIVNSPEGYVTAWSSPEEKRAYGNISNGTALEVTASYLGWNAVTYINADGLQQCYWIPADRMTEQLSGETFLRDNSERLSYDKSDLKSMKYYTVKDRIYLYSYPGSGVVSSELNDIGKFDAGIVFSAVYTDYDGYKWGYLEYYGDWNYKAWICINEPENGELPARDNGNTVYEAVEPCDGETKLHYSIALKDPQQETLERVIIAAAAAIFLTVLTAIVVSIVMNRDKPRREKKEKAPKEPKPKREKEPKMKQPAAAEITGELSEEKVLEESWQRKISERKPQPKKASNAKKGRHEKQRTRPNNNEKRG